MCPFMGDHVAGAIPKDDVVEVSPPREPQPGIGGTGELRSASIGRYGWLPCVGLVAKGVMVSPMPLQPPSLLMELWRRSAAMQPMGEAIGECPGVERAERPAPLTPRL
mmetsp:Transcript_44692/g.128244  ORF Transcript_44692/g.128244 Transcript_44692/m.128244 type:complete len:108 (+) Transcript_44692:401-724(+)